MAYYRLYFLQGGGFARFEEFEAADDAAALDMAATFARGDAMELWCRNRRVHQFEARKAG